MTIQGAKACPEGERRIDGKCKTVVIFRKFIDAPDGSKYDKGLSGVVALFPDIKVTLGGHCESYMHVGQHGAADYYGLIPVTKLADKKEYAPLLKELHSIGYRNLAIREKWMR